MASSTPNIIRKRRSSRLSPSMSHLASPGALDLDCTFYSIAEKDLISSILFMLYLSYLWATSFLVFIYIIFFLPLGDLISSILFILYISYRYFGDACLKKFHSSV